MPDVTLTTLNKLKQNGEKIVCLTAYDATFAHVESVAGVEVMLVGDSLGMVLQGHDSTLPVSVDDMAYHTQAVKRGNRGALIMADLPFMAYATLQDALRNSAQLMQAGAHMVKLEGAGWLAENVSMLSRNGIPVCAHLGLTPQTVNILGGYKVQGREEAQAKALLDDAVALEAAGASMLLLECVPSALANQITAAVKVPVIGIGAGSGTDGQVLVVHDMLGLSISGRLPRFVKNFMIGQTDIAGAISAYVTAVKQVEFQQLNTSSESMNTLHTIAQLRAAVSRARQEGKRIGLVPTMGNLHAGHIALVEKALQRTDYVVVSIFVNPLQFGAGEDLDSYPRTLPEDQAKLHEIGTHMIFAPSVSDIYPEGMEGHTRVAVPVVSEGLCGSSRPGHFEGVATVVNKLLNIVQPDLAIFGQKDFQQLAVIRKMAHDLCMPVQIMGEPTVRAADGLALSSRNGYLNAEQRACAPVLYRTLQQIAEKLQAGRQDFATVIDEAQAQLVDAGLTPDYLDLRDAHSLQPVTTATRELVALAAAYLGKTRLIDNLQFSLA